MKTITIQGAAPSPRQLDDIVSALRDGQIAIIPTDTIYAIACDALNPKAIERLCQLKGINPAKTNLSIICKDIAMASQYARIDNAVFRMLNNNTPGPFTFLLRAASSLPKAFKGRKTVGVRIPDNDTARMITEAMEGPLLTTSVEYDDEDYGCEPGLIAENYEGKADMIIDAGRGGTSLSTIVDCREADYEIIREGKGILQ